MLWFVRGHALAVCPSCMLQAADAIAYVTVPPAYGADAIVLWDSPDAHKPCVGFHLLLCFAFIFCSVLLRGALPTMGV